MNIFKARGSRAGRLVQDRVSNIPVIAVRSMRQQSFRRSVICSPQVSVGSGNVNHHLPPRVSGLRADFNASQPSVIAKPPYTMHVNRQLPRTLVRVRRADFRLPIAEEPRILVSNCRSVLGKLDFLQSTATHHQVNVICLCETWLNPLNCFLLDNSFPNYLSFHVCRTDRQGGGVSLLINNNFTAEFVKSFLTADIELLAVLLTISKTHVLRPYIHLIICVYRPPSGDHSQFVAILDDFLISRPKSHYTTILGDFNRVDTKDIELLYGLMPRVTFKTRENATLDQILSNTQNFGDPVRIEPIGTSDHVSLGFFPRKNTSVCEKHTVKVHDKRHKFSIAAEISLHNADWSPVFNSVNADAAQTALHKILSTSLSKFPVRNVTITNNDPQWKGPLIKDLERRRTKAFRKNDEPLVRELTNTLKNEISKAKERHIQKLSRGSRGWWQEVKSTLKSTNKCLSSYTQNFANDYEAASAYNQVLIQRFTESVPLASHPCLSNHPNTPEVSLHDVILGIRGLKIRSAPGPDNIPVWFLKMFESHLAKPLTALFNLSLKTGVFPVEWKRAIIIPLPKNKRPSTANDLRPISLTSIIAKIFERLVLKMITPHWRSIMHEDQYAYRPLSSTTCALTSIEHHWLSTLDDSKGSYIRVFALDFTKAFDCIEHSLLLGKICSYGFDNWLIVWLHSFLSGRTQQVRVNQATSPCLPISRGIPQGTVIGPFTFVVYTNDLRPFDESRMSVVKYADDQTWSYVVKYGEADNSSLELQAIEVWCNENKMSVNEKKSFEMIITNVRQPLNLPPSFINKKELQRVDNMKILGLTLSSDLKWDVEISSKIAKCKSLIYALEHLRYTHNVRDIAYLYRSVFIPTICYCSPVWCNLSKTLLQKLQVTCNRASRIADDHCEIEELVGEHVLSLFVKSGNPCHPLYYIVAPHLLRGRRDNVRRNRLLSVRSRTTRFLNSFLPFAIRLFNQFS